MKYLVYRMTGNGFKMNALTEIENKEEIEKSGYEIVGFYKTKKEARETIQNLGGWIS